MKILLNVECGIKPGFLSAINIVKNQAGKRLNHLPDGNHQPLERVGDL